MLTLDARRIDRLSHGPAYPPAPPPLCDPLSVHMAELLPARQRAIVRGVYVDQLSIRKVAELTGLPAGTVSRIARRAYRRLREPVLLALARRFFDLTDPQRAIAVAHFAHGLGPRRLARQFGLSRSSVTCTIAFLRGWARAVNARRSG